MRTRNYCADAEDAELRAIIFLLRATCANLRLQKNLLRWKPYIERKCLQCTQYILSIFTFQHRCSLTHSNSVCIPSINEVSIGQNGGIPLLGITRRNSQAMNGCISFKKKAQLCITYPAQLRPSGSINRNFKKLCIIFIINNKLP